MRQFLAKILLAAICLAPLSARGEIHTGTGYLVSWDFSEAKIGANLWDVADLITAAAPLGAAPASYYLWGNRGIYAAPSGVTYEELMVAPTDPMEYDELVPFVAGRVWVVWTREGHYAKMRFLDDLSLTNQFQYAYQDDGSPILDNTVAILPSTWGRIKALYE